MRLFIAEKPSVAKAIVAELGCVTRGDGFITCKDGSVVTWCFGHLLEQAEPDAYLPDDVPRTKKGSKVWRFEDLPIYPKNWKLLPKNDKGVKKQLATIGKLLKKASLVVHAGDPDRRGSSSSMKFWNTSATPAACNASGFPHRTVRRYAKDSPTFETTRRSTA